jgi:hypothetical protein
MVVRALVGCDEDGAVLGAALNLQSAVLLIVGQTHIIQGLYLPSGRDP